MIQQFPCSVCHKSIGNKGNSIFRDLCKLWGDIKCNNLNYVDYQYLLILVFLINQYLSVFLIFTLKYMLLAI